MRLLPRLGAPSLLAPSSQFSLDATTSSNFSACAHEPPILIADTLCSINADCKAETRLREQWPVSERREVSVQSADGRVQVEGLNKSVAAGL